MALAWRLVPPEFADALNGKGNVERGARWNSPGRGVVYASFNLSLCVLESLAQMPPPMRLKLPVLAAVRLEIPDDPPMRDGSLVEVPDELDAEPAQLRCREIGDAWLTEGKQLVLTAPSFIVPQERNVMINPAHQFMARVKIVSIERFRFDSRLAARHSA
jgi:RES domain-containing protein